MLGCVLMASGLGRRFGGDKLMADFDGSPLISRALAATANLFDKRVLLTRSAAAAEFARARGVAVTLHTLPRRSDAMRLGLEQMAEMDGCLFCPCDQPLLTRQTVAALAAAFARQPGTIWRLSAAGQPGAPVVFPRWAFAELAAGQQGGGSAVAAAHPDRVRLLEVDAWELFDVDTPADLAAALAHYRAGSTALRPTSSNSSG